MFAVWFQLGMRNAYTRLLGRKNINILVVDGYYFLLFIDTTVGSHYY